jgi:filamentous hemagglutinin
VSHGLLGEEIQGGVPMAPYDARPQSVKNVEFAMNVAQLVPFFLGQFEVGADFSVVAEAETAAPIAAADEVESAVGGSIRDVNPTGGTTNCANCAVATDSTLSGSPASAVPGGPTSAGALSKFYGGSPWIPTTGPQGISTIMTNAGAGSRAIVFGTRGAEMGHFFNVVNQGGAIRFLDGQIGGAADLGGYDGWYIMFTN